MNNNIASDCELCPLLDGREIPRSFESENTVHDFPEAKHHQKQRKKRTKFIKIENYIGVSSSARPKYGKKPDPAAPKITPPCSECGKKFWSWKALFGHMRCHPERQWRGINPPVNLQRRFSSEITNSESFEDIMTEEDHHVATCLLMLANGPTISETPTLTINTMGNQQAISDSETNSRFECSSCKKVFGSHQALGGHRASHKNVKGCFAITRNYGENEEAINGGNGGEVDNDKMGMFLGHKCSMCSRIFSSGQALGGHKRCHWEKGDEPKEACGLDLNLPPPVEDDTSSSYYSDIALDLRLGL